jgi:hypothetical protein
MPGCGVACHIDVLGVHRIHATGPDVREQGCKWRIGCRISRRPVAHPCVEHLQTDRIPRMKHQMRQTAHDAKRMRAAAPGCVYLIHRQGPAGRSCVVRLRSPQDRRSTCVRGIYGRQEARPRAASCYRSQDAASPAGASCVIASRARNPLVAVPRGTVVTFGARAARLRSNPRYAAYSSGGVCVSGSPISIGLLVGSWLHSNQPPSYTAIRDQPWRYA